METITNADRGYAKAEIKASEVGHTKYDTTIAEGDYDEEIHGVEAADIKEETESPWMKMVLQ